MALAEVWFPGYLRTCHGTICRIYNWTCYNIVEKADPEVEYVWRL